MDDHPGDTLGKRFLTWWGTVFAILAFGVALYLLKGVFGPGKSNPLDGGSETSRREKLGIVNKEQAEELAKYEFNKEKGAVRLPPADAIPYAASILSQEKPKEGPYVPGMAPVDPNKVDPNLLKFEGK